MRPSKQMSSAYQPFLACHSGPGTSGANGCLAGFGLGMVLLSNYAVMDAHPALGEVIFTKAGRIYVNRSPCHPL